MNSFVAVSNMLQVLRTNFDMHETFYLTNEINIVEKPLIKQEPNTDVLSKKTTERHRTVGDRITKAIKPRLLSGVVCTSTPRKSKVHFDQRRLISQLLTSSPSPSPLAVEHKNASVIKKISPPDVSIIETPLTALPHNNELVKAPPSKQSTAKRLEAIAAGLKNKRRQSCVYGRRLSRRMEEICTPTSGETTSSAAFSNTPKENKNSNRRQTLNSLQTTTTSTSKAKRIRKKAQKEKGARPSLHLRGSIFVKYRTPTKGAQRVLNKHKSRKQRNDHFNKGRNLKTLKGKDEENTTTTDDEGEDTIIRNLTYDIKNNNYTSSTYNRNDKLLGQTILLKKKKASEIKKESFSNNSEIFNSHPTDTNEWIEDCTDDEVYDDSEEYDHHQDDTDDDQDIKHAIPDEKNASKQELVKSYELEEFDRFISKTNNKENNHDSFSSNGSSECFEKLLLETKSTAPFHIKHTHFKHHQHLDDFVSNSQSQHDVSMATPHLSPTTTPGHLSRIIYGGTVIYNRRLPNINTTHVRKSSIYIKNINDSTADCNDVVLITNQTITLVDLARMWRQMDSSTRLIVSFAALASFTTLLGLLLSFCSKHYHVK